MELHYKSIGNELFRGLKITSGSMLQALMEYFPNNVSMFHGDMLKMKRIAIVGNAFMSGKYGEEIDSHDIIIRCNKGLFSPEMNPDITGSKTHICFAGALSVLLNSRFKSILSRNPEITLVAPFSFLDEEVALNKLIASFSHANRISYITESVSYKCAKLVPQKSRPSTGFVATNIALQQSPGNIDLYGFTFSDFNRIENKRSFTTQHSFGTEREQMLRYKNDGLLYIHE